MNRSYPPTGKMIYVECLCCKKRDVATVYYVNMARWLVPPTGWLARAVDECQKLEVVCSADCALGVV